jgi:ribosomal protein S18 acetylase RimI-like enzyme
MFTLKEAKTEDDWIIAEHFYKLWLDNDIPPESIKDNWQETILDFIKIARQQLSYKAFIAEVNNPENNQNHKDNNQVIASVSCQIFAGLYPHAIKEEYRKYGYIWGVYVEPNYRRQGLATQLTKTAVDYLKSLNCTRVVLNASPTGKPVYSNLGFCESNLMHLDLFTE